MGFVFLFLLSKNFSNIFLIFFEFFKISFSDSNLRVLSFPDGSPILVVPPPNNTIGLLVYGRAFEEVLNTLFGVDYPHEDFQQCNQNLCNL